MSELQAIQELQFAHREEAERRLISFFHEQLGLDALDVELRPLAVSLNSFNGFVTLASGEHYFFKSHTEPDNIITEYYNAAQLADAGYPVLRPALSSSEAGRQILLYPVVTDESVFDVAWRIENGDRSEWKGLTLAQHRADDALAYIYQRTLQPMDAETNGRAPIHQLFWHRITGGRLQRFYASEHVPGGITLPDGTRPAIDDFFESRWTINGRRYASTLAELIRSAETVLHPQQAGPGIIGHGDAHNGNVFYQRESASLQYFDPAFAGRHHPLLDLVKPLYHNVFAMWMYFPHVVAARLPIEIVRRADGWHITFDEELPPVREMFLASKVERVLLPTMRLLRQQGLLEPDWRLRFRLALMCCPLLTLNLADADRFPAVISMLGFAHSVMMGSELAGGQPSRIDALIEGMEAVD